MDPQVSARRQDVPHPQNLMVSLSNHEVSCVWPMVRQAHHEGGVGCRTPAQPPAPAVSKNSYPRSFQLRYSAFHPVARTASATNVKRQDSRGGQIVALGAGGLGCGYSDPPARITRRLGMRMRLFLFREAPASRDPSTPAGMISVAREELCCLPIFPPPTAVIPAHAGIHLR
jgi:hypothetical protein